MWCERDEIGWEKIWDWYKDWDSNGTVRCFEAKAVQTGRHSIIKDTQKYARESTGLQLKLDFPDPVCYTADGHEVRGEKIKNCLTEAHQQDLKLKFTS